MSQQVKNSFASVTESVSTVFRHILPGILIIAVGMLAWPSWFTELDTTNTNSIIILAAIAMVIGNVWYVFHRYFVLQFIDFLAYHFRAKGQPRKQGKSDYRTDLAKHVSKFFSAPKSNAFGKHIRDRFSSFNFMFIISEVLIFFVITAEELSFVREHQWVFLVGGIVGTLAAFWQYLIVRSIDAEFSNMNWHKGGTEYEG